MVSAMALKALPGFEALTGAEASAIGRTFDERSVSDGERLAADGSLLVVGSGAVRLVLEGPAERGLARLGRGGLFGELAFFEPEPVSLLAIAEGDGRLLAADRAELKNAFRYSRTGAVKLMTVFARSLSEKLRAANERLSAAAIAAEEDADAPAPLGRLDRQRLRSLVTRRSYEDGATIFEEGEPGDALYVVVDGAVEILKRREGKPPLTLARLGPGAFFGEMAFVDRGPRSAAAVARSPVTVQVLPAGRLERTSDYNVGTALYLTSILCKILARRLNATLRRLARSAG